MRSLNANKDSFFAMLNSLESYPEILILTETWYTNDSIIEINGFVGFHTLRGNQRRSGGVSIYIDKRINPKFLPNFSFSNLSIEICSVKFKIGSEMWYLFGVYRPHSGTNDELIEHLNEILNSAELGRSKILIAGDMNLNLLGDSRETENFVNFLHSHHFISKISKPTRFSPRENIFPSLLDHLWTNSLTDYPCGILSFDILDHCPIFILLKSRSHNPKNSERKKITFRLNNEENFYNMCNDITQFDWDSLLSEDVHSSMENFLAQLNSFYQRNFPLKTKLVLVRNCNNPWVTPEISKLLEYKNTLFNLLRREVISIEENNVFKNKVQRVLRKSKENYYKTSFARAKGDLKKTWELIKSLTGKEETRDAIIQIIDGTNQITDENTMAETFNIFFNNIASNLTQNLPQCNINPLSDINRNIHSMYVSPVTVEEISKIILSLKPKKSHIDTGGIAILKTR